MNVRCLLLLLLALLAGPAAAQVPEAPAPGHEESADRLRMTTTERQFFALGLTLSRGAFAYAELAGQASLVSRTRSKVAQVGKLGKLAGAARRDRLIAGEYLSRTLVLMQALNAPPATQAPLRQASEHLASPLVLTSEARPLAVFSGAAAQTLSSLSEFETLSTLPEDPALRKWLASAAVPASAQVWYGEGEIAALAQIAAAQQMPELLPPAAQIATDLRGLRDWLALRLPDNPSPDQAGLQKSLEAFLHDPTVTATARRKSRKPLSPAQLDALGGICRLLQTQVLGPEPAPRETATLETRFKSLCIAVSFVSEKKV